VIHTALDADGVLAATIDMAGRTMNMFSVALMDALDALMERVDADAAVRSVVPTSGKPTFLAGADLAMVRGYCDAARTPGSMPRCRSSSFFEGHLPPCADGQRVHGVLTVVKVRSNGQAI